MNSEPYNKESVDAIPLGKPVLSIIGSPLWIEEGRAQQLFDTIFSIMKGVIEEQIIPACGLLRLVVAASDFPTEVARWQRQLGQPEGTSSNSEGETAGKTLLWGNGEPKSTYAVIILPEAIALGLIEGDNRLKSTAKGTLIHELAHVHEEYLYLQAFGPQPIPMNNDWIGIRRAIANATWTEFFAESVAYAYFKDYWFEELVSLGVTLLQGSLQRIEQAILEFRSHGNIGSLWELTTSEISKVFNQLGRSIGLLTATQQDGNEQFGQFFKSVDEISLVWGQIVRQLVDKFNILARQEKWNSESFNDLEDVVEQGFRVTGIHPNYIDQKLWIDVLPSPID